MKRSRSSLVRSRSRLEKSEFRGKPRKIYNDSRRSRRRNKSEMENNDMLERCEFINLIEDNNRITIEKQAEISKDVEVWEAALEDFWHK